MKQNKSEKESENIRRAIFYIEQDIKRLKDELESKEWELNLLLEKLK